MLETLKLSRDDFNAKYKNGKFLYLTLKSSRDGFNVLDNFNVSSIKTAIICIDNFMLFSARWIKPLQMSSL